MKKKIFMGKPTQQTYNSYDTRRPFRPDTGTSSVDVDFEMGNCRVKSYLVFRDLISHVVIEIKLR